MIERKNLVKAGHFIKTHGINGELTIAYDKSTWADIDTPCYIVCLEGLFIPFFIAEIRFSGELSARISFLDVDTIEQASVLSGLDFYIEKKYLSEQPDEESATELDLFIGYHAFDKSTDELIGTIEDIDANTENVLFIITSPQNHQVLIPAVDSFIAKADHKNHKIYFDLPEGLLDLSDTTA